MLKAQWALTDSQLGTLGGVVTLMVGVLTIRATAASAAASSVRHLERREDRRSACALFFPLLKAAWSLSDAKLGALGGVVALMVGLLTAPHCRSWPIASAGRAASRPQVP